MSLTEAASQALHTQESFDNVSDWCPLQPVTAVGGFSLQIATTIQAIEMLRPIWRRWAYSLDTDIDYYLHNLKNDSAILHPYVITAYNDGVAQAMLVGQIRRRRASAVVSFVNIPGPDVRVLEIKKGGRMGRPSSAIDKLLALELLRVAKGGDLDLLSFERLPLHSGLFREVQQLPGILVQERVPHVFCYSVLSWNERKRSGVFSGKIRREIRRKTRILQRAFTDQVQLKCFSQADDLDAGMCDAMRVAVNTWQYYLGLGLSDTARTRETFRFFAKQGWLRIYVLYIKNNPCAFLVGQLYDNTFYCQYAGYQPNFARFSVGSLLTARVFEELAAAGVQGVDLGEGGQEHNRRLGCKMSEEGTVHLYAPTFRGVWLNMFFEATQIVRAGGRTTRSGLRLKRFSKIWQQYLIARWKSRHSTARLGAQQSI
jgi:hypothetical protein